MDVDSGPSAIALGKRSQRTNSLDEATAAEELLNRQLVKRREGTTEGSSNISLHLTSTPGAPPISILSGASGFSVNTMIINTITEAGSPCPPVEADILTGTSRAPLPHEPQVS